MAKCFIANMKSSFFHFIILLLQDMFASVIKSILSFKRLRIAGKSNLFALFIIIQNCKIRLCFKSRSKCHYFLLVIYNKYQLTNTVYLAFSFIVETVSIKYFGQWGLAVPGITPVFCFLVVEDFSSLHRLSLQTQSRHCGRTAKVRTIMLATS